MPDRDRPFTEAAPMALLRQPARDVARRGSDVGVQRGPADAVACRLGDASCAAAHATTLHRATADRTMMGLQRQFGNHYVGRVLQRMGSAGDAGLDDVERSIDGARGSGQTMDRFTLDRMESSFGADFSGVRIHTDARADDLSQSLAARAFTTGQDVFFRQGEYDPGSTAGRELLAHELTHVVQQNGDGIRRKMTVSEPGDPQEREADAMARQVIEQERTGSDAVARQPEALPDDEDRKPVP